MTSADAECLAMYITCKYSCAFNNILMELSAHIPETFPRRMKYVQNVLNVLIGQRTKYHIVEEHLELTDAETARLMLLADTIRDKRDTLIRPNYLII